MAPLILTDDADFRSAGVATLTPPASPVDGQTWLSNNLKHLRMPKGRGKRAHIRTNGQEQNVFISGDYWYNLFTSGSTVLELMRAPVTADITKSSVFYGTISGSILTITEPTNLQSPDLGSPVMAGMTLCRGSGAWATIQPFGTGGTTGKGGAGTYALSAAPGDVVLPTRLEANFWSKPTPVIGGGAGGVTPNVSHSGVYREGDTLYCYYVAQATTGTWVAQNTYVSTADIADPFTWTPVTTAVLGIMGTGSANGNVSVVKSGSTYYMFQEAIGSTVNPAEGLTNAWQVYLATASSPTGPFTLSIGPLRSLMPGPNGTASHLRVIETDDDGTFIALYHGNTNGRAFPTLGYRATTTDLSTDSWTILDNGQPFARIGGHPYEADQIADIEFCRSPTGVGYLFYSACNNGRPEFHIMCAPLVPSAMQFDGVSWVPSESHDDSEDTYQHPLSMWQPNHLLPSAEYGAWTRQAISGAAAGGLVSGSASGEYVTYDLTGLKRGTYALDMLVCTGSANGIIDVNLGDGAGLFNFQLTTFRNRLLNSTLLTGSGWNQTNVSAPAAASGITSPDGSVGTGWLITANTTGACRLNQNYPTIATGDPITVVAYLKPGTAGSYLAIVQSGVLAYVAVDADGTVRTSGPTGYSYTVGAADANGWRRVSLSASSANTTGIYIAVGPQNNTGLNSGYPACGTSGLTMYAYLPKLALASEDDGYDIPTYGSLGTIDTYSASGVQNVKRSLVFDVFNEDGRRRALRVRSAAKNGSSSGYKMEILGLSLRRLTK